MLLHVGWPKTGTSTLQKHVLSKVPGHRYLGKYPFNGEQNRHTFDLVYLLAYASKERFERSAGAVLEQLRKIEQERFGNVDPTLPMIISEEGILSALLKPSDHQHHGISTASWTQIVHRVDALEETWGMRIDLLMTQRDPIEVLHAYYAQMYHVFSRFPGMGNLRSYLSQGVAGSLHVDLGFENLIPGWLETIALQRQGIGRFYAIAMADLFEDRSIRLSAWHPTLQDMEVEGTEKENVRSREKGVKISHIHPIWQEARPFRIVDFLRRVRTMYRRLYLPHERLEVPIVLEAQDRNMIAAFLHAHEKDPHTPTSI